MNAALLYPFILVAGALQALGNSMNAQLRGRMVNPWLAATVSFLPIVFVFVTLFLTMPTPLPTLDSLGTMPWYAPLGGVAGAVAVFGGLAFIDKVGAGPFNGLTLTANIITSLAMDALGLFGLQAAGFKPLPWLGGLLMAIGVVFIARTAGKKDEGEKTSTTGKLLGGPEIHARGSGIAVEAFDEIIPQIEQALEEAAANAVTDSQQIRRVVKRTVGRWVNETFRRRPMIIPVVIEV